MTELKSLVGEVYLAYRPKTVRRVKIKGSRDVYDYAVKLWDDTLGVNEKMLILFLNRASNVIGYNWHSLGSTYGTLVERKTIVKMALDLLAEGVIMVHNHPSGNIEPSGSDRQMTGDVKDALHYMAINLLDHVIISHINYFSFSDEGVI